MTGGDLEATVENGTDRSVCENEEKTVDVLEALLRCTRIFVKVGEIGKYSISESSVEIKVSDRFAFSYNRAVHFCVLYPATRKNQVA